MDSKSKWLVVCEVIFEWNPVLVRSQVISAEYKSIFAEGSKTVLGNMISITISCDSTYENDSHWF